MPRDREFSEKALGALPDLYEMSLREVVPNDAEYIYGLRIDQKYNRYISKISGGVEGQLQYIKKYLLSSCSERTSFYFVLTNKTTGKRCGTVRLYNFRESCFEWGSWILDHNKSKYAALETAIFVYEFAFSVLGFSYSEFEVNKENHGVIKFHRRSGANIFAEDDINFYFRIDRDTALSFAAELRKKLETKHTKI